MAQVPSVISARPTLVVDGQYGRRVVDNKAEGASTDPTVIQGSIGTPSSFLGRHRLVTALPTNQAGPVCLKSAIVFCDFSAYLVDKDNNFIGEGNAIWVPRMVSARWVEDTRRLGG
jgi:hypothetical protein